MSNFQIFNIKIGLYEREINVLKKYDFSEEIHKDKISQDDKWIMTDLKQKGFIYEYQSYYQGTVSYKQIREII